MTNDEIFKEVQIIKELVVEGFRRNELRWQENDRRWEENDKRWAENDKRWAGNDEKWRKITIQLDEITKKLENHDYILDRIVEKLEDTISAQKSHNSRLDYHTLQIEDHQVRLSVLEDSQL
jgi:exonuclease VII small subunit